MKLIKTVISSLFMISLLILKIAQAQVATTCTLPDSTVTSTCQSIRSCSYFEGHIKRLEGRTATNKDREEMRRHQCPSGRYDVCCPPSPNAALITELKAPQIDFDKIKNHKNIGLLNARKCGVTKAIRVSGGHEADLGQFPWMALLIIKLELEDQTFDNVVVRCGGSLISEFFVLTAAHCVTRRLIGVRLGEHRISTETDCDLDGFCLDPVQNIPVEKRIKHESYKRGIRQHDIALLKLSKPADLSKSNVNTICLPTTEKSQLDKIDPELLPKMFVLGWGNIDNSSSTSDVLMTANIRFVSLDQCVERYKQHSIKIYEKNFCAGGSNSTDTCRGDSGGPIQNFAEINDKIKMVQFGVLSGGVDCNVYEEFFPGVFTDVAQHLDWILDNMSL